MFGDWLSLLLIVYGLVLVAIGTFAAAWMVLDILSGRYQKRFRDLMNSGVGKLEDLGSTAMNCPRCGAAMQQTYNPYEGYCSACHLLYDFYAGKEIGSMRTLTAYEQLQLENQRLREALKPFAEIYNQHIKADTELNERRNWGDYHYSYFDNVDSRFHIFMRQASEALEFSAIGLTIEAAPKVDET